MHPDRSATHSFDPRLGQGLHSFLHGGHGSADKTPKVLLLLEGKEAELPDWYTSWSNPNRNPCPNASPNPDLNPNQPEP